MNLIQNIKELCEDICDFSSKPLSKSGPYFQYYWKNFDCDKLFKHKWDEMGPKWPNPPKWNDLPSGIQREFTWNGLFSVFDNAQNDNWNISESVWTYQMIEAFQKLYAKNKLPGNYGWHVVHKITK